MADDLFGLSMGVPDDAVISGSVNRRKRSSRRGKGVEGSWQLDFQFGSGGENALLGATSIDVGPTFIAVADFNKCKLHTYSGVHDHPALRLRQTFNVNYRPMDVAVALDGRCFVTDDGPTVSVYSAKGKYLSKFPSSNPTYETMSEVLSVTIDSKQRVLVGERVAMGFRGVLAVAMDLRGVVPATQNRVSVYTLDGSLVQSINVDIPPWYIAATPDGDIVISPDCRDNIRIYDMNGVLRRSLKPPDGVSPMAWCPSGVCCSQQGDIFVSNREGDIGVYQFTKNGEYLGCLTKDAHVPTVAVNIPRGMAMSKEGDTLLVADWASVKVFSRVISRRESQMI